MSDPTPAEHAVPPAAADPRTTTDSPAAVDGRRTLSTAFVRVGPDGHLTVELRDGRVVVLRNVTISARDYCGEPVAGAPGGKKFCGDFADVSAARPGGGPVSGSPDHVSGVPIMPANDSTKPD